MRAQEEEPGRPAALCGATAGASVEFGAYMEKLSWDNFNESMTLKEAVERYKERHGGYPVSIHVDTIYCKRENINYCRERGVRISEPRLGRPPKEPDLAAKKLARQDALDRNHSESKFGEGKRKYESFDRPFSRIIFGLYFAAKPDCFSRKPDQD